MTKTELNKLTKEELVDKALEFLKGQNEAKDEVKALEATIKDMGETIESLNQERKDASSGKKFVEHGKQRYEVLVPVFKLDGKKCTYKDLKEEESLLKDLLKIQGQQIVKPVKK